MILSDREILCMLNTGELEIKPFNEKSLQPAGYDLRLDTKFAIYTSKLLDTKNKDTLKYELIEVSENEGLVLKPHQFVLGSSVEYIRLPDDIAAFIQARSSIARLGLIIHFVAGFIDPGFEGRITFEMINLNNVPIKIYPGMRVAQIIFMKLPTKTLKSYRTKGDAKYLGQTIPLPSMIYKDFEKSQSTGDELGKTQR
jgi:dCTP deaminase